MIDQHERRIVGLGPGPYALDERPFSWPTAGFDRHEWLYVFRQTGKPRPTRAEWIALADEMLARWSAFRQAADAIVDPPIRRYRNGQWVEIDPTKEAA